MSDEVKFTNYWKSLNELAKNEEYQKFEHREFPENGSELNDAVSRRSFLRIMGASVALAGFAACRRPVQKIIPYTKQPEEVIPGVPLFYASAMPFQDALTGLVIENHEGRPTKVEGNEMHPASMGSTSKYNQASMLEMYDPDRSRKVLQDGKQSSYNDFVKFSEKHFAETSQKIAFISEANSSPTYNRIKDQALKKFPNARWVAYEPFGEDNALEGTHIAFGQRLRTVNHYDKATVIVAFDNDFLNPASNKNSVEATKKYTKARKVASTDDDMSRLYAVESTFTLTGSNADNRLRIKSSEVPLFIYALAANLSGRIDGLSAFSGISNKFSDHEWVGALAEDLVANQGASVLTAGPEHSPEVHAAVAVINKALGNTGATVRYHKVPHIDDQYNREVFAEVVSDMASGSIDTVVIIGANPAFTAPSDLSFKEALSKVQTSIHLGLYADETAKLCNWHINRAHYLESWGDGYSYSGARSVIQPQIEPLFSGISEIEFLNALVNGTQTKGHALLKETWKQYIRSDFNDRWEKILHDGIESTDNFPEENPSVSENFNATAQKFAAASESKGVELVIRPDSTLFDGRYANNGWLQELPDPLTKITWDNVALMSKKMADKLGIEAAGLGAAKVKVLAITVNGTTVKIPAWIQPGHADDSITITVGYGRQGIGRVANGVGVDTYPLRTTTSMLYATDIKIDHTNEIYEIASTQDHSSMEGRSLLRYATLDEYRKEPDFASYEKAYGGAELPGLAFAKEKGKDSPLTIFDAIDDQEYPDYQPQWGMTIDLNSCIGCGTCTIACQAENNIPVIGKSQVSNGREMHWIRTDRYFEGDVDNPKALHQPVPCMHCELAPCEQVCPVAATTHSDDGMNQMTYNRCIGTRYCANNCPYKVRRFNFFNYSKEFLTDGSDPEVIQMAMNPDVTVRFRGVMEKCSYCVQRVNRAKIQTQIDTGGASMKPKDGTVKTACQQACPTDAINFGDLTDKSSTVSQTKMNDRNYLLLEELNTRPRTSYLAKLRNPNPKLA